jgi:hypothetical protein
MIREPPLSRSEWHFIDDRAEEPMPHVLLGERLFRGCDAGHVLADQENLLMKVVYFSTATGPPLPR